MIQHIDMDNILTTFKPLLITVLSIIMAYLAPVTSMVYAIFLLFLVNFMAGLIAGLIVEKEAFSVRKFFHCLLETMVFFVIVIVVYVLGDLMDKPGAAIQCITGIVYAVLYFYGVNVFRNLSKLFPDSRTLKFLYYVLSFEILKKVPFLRRFEEQEKAAVEGKDNG